jgi:hypothetical protein
MSSRDYIRHLVSANTAPIGARVGDEYFDPVTNKLFKVLAINGTTVTSTEIFTTNPVVRIYTADGVQTQFTVSSGQKANSIFVFENGLCQVPDFDYTVSGSILTFQIAPLANVVVQIREM